MTNYVNCKNSEGSGNYRKFLKSEGNDSNLLIVFYVQGDAANLLI